MSVHVVYLHGFGSGPDTTRKGRTAREHLADRARSFAIPDLEGDDFFALTMHSFLDRAREAIAELPDDGLPLLLIGSSLGGYAAATITHEGLARPAALQLIAPAFGFTRRWNEILGEEGIREWEEKGSRSFFHHRTGEDRHLGVDFLASCRNLPEIPPPNPHPTVIVHGTGDETVDPAYSRVYADRHPACELHLVDGDHSLDGDRHLDLLRDAWDRLVAKVEEG